jgi:hypothetical protein
MTVTKEEYFDWVDEQGRREPDSILPNDPPHRALSGEWVE